MRYKNEECKKVKGAFIMEVSCAKCLEKIARYQKLGQGGLLRMYMDRIIESQVDLYQEDKGLRCPKCGNLIASRSFNEKRGVEAYNMIRGSYRTKRK